MRLRAKPSPIPTFPLRGPSGTPRAVNDAEGNQGFPPRLLSLKPTPIPTFPLRGKESFAGALRLPVPSPSGGGLGWGWV
jgi:hypothetical protein